MLGLETERRLKNFLVAIGDGECQLERSRQRLCEIRDFAPYSLFQRLDRDCNSYISSFELLSFVKENGMVGVSEMEIYELVKFFDSNEDGKLNQSELEQMVLPCEDNTLRRMTLDRASYRVGRYDYLPRDIERGFTDIVEQELGLLRRLDLLKSELSDRYDYSNYGAYKAIDRYSEGFIDTFSLKKFLATNGHFATEKELLAIIRRMDTDGDAKLSYEEFSEFLRISYPRPSLASESAKNRSYSAEKNKRMQSSSYGSPLRAKSSYSSPARTMTESRGRNLGNYQATPERHSSPLKESNNLSGMKMQQLREASPKKGPALRLSDEDELVRTFREQISLERELENAKISLVQKPDFNIFDAFRIFDIDSKGWVTLSELRLALNDIGVFPSLDELDLFFQRYDKNHDGRIRFSEFCDAFTPLDNYYATLLNRRTSNNQRGRSYARDDCFMTDTKLEFKQVWRTHLKIETFAEQLRQRLAKRPGFNIYEAFGSCDLNEDGRVTKQEIKTLIESRGYYVSEKEMNTLVEKFDKDKDGRISYAEFREEITPHSPVRM